MWPRDEQPVSRRPRPDDDDPRRDPPVPVRLALDHGFDGPGPDDGELYLLVVPRPRSA